MGQLALNWRLLEAAKLGDAEQLQQLLQSGANKDATGKNMLCPGWTSLMFAAEAGHAECVKLLLDAGVDIERRTATGCTALMYAAMDGRAECIRLLLDAGADKAAVNQMGQSAFVFAAMEGHHELLERLDGPHMHPRE